MRFCALVISLGAQCAFNSICGKACGERCSVLESFWCLHQSLELQESNKKRYTASIKYRNENLCSFLQDIAHSFCVCWPFRMVFHLGIENKIQP